MLTCPPKIEETVCHLCNCIQRDPILHFTTQCKSTSITRDKFKSYILDEFGKSFYLYIDKLSDSEFLHLLFGKQPDSTLTREDN